MINEVATNSDCKKITTVSQSFLDSMIDPGQTAVLEPRQHSQKRKINDLLDCA